MTEWRQGDVRQERQSDGNLGGTLRLGAYECVLEEGSRAAEAYQAKTITERHRHRYEVNPEYLPGLEVQGLYISGRSPDGLLTEVIELKDHPWFVAVQYHPEFKSRPFAAHPLFLGFVKAALAQKTR
jgi:CTP synthase